jgi:CubicO group peptidase (beta-lactamase class C family)
MTAPFDSSRLGDVVDRLFDPAAEAELGLTLAFLAVHRGQVVAERYGLQPDTAFGPGDDVTEASTLISWSMAKSITHALVGICVADGLLDPSAPAPVPEWSGDGRRAITLQHLLEMRSGLDFVEDYVDGGVSHVIDMLFGAGKDDVAAYAAARPIAHEPGTRWSYSSGTTNIIARIVGDAIAPTYGTGQAGMEHFMHERLFGPIGMSSAVPKFDTAGTFIGSSFVYATTRDFARFGELYLHDGVWNGVRILPQGWVDHARTPVPVPASETFGYGAHFWLWRGEEGSLGCHGYEGQRTVMVPERDLVLVRLGKTAADLGPNLDAVLASAIGCFPRSARSASK